MNINKKPLALPTVCGPLKKRVDTHPDYQRPLVWSKSQRQLLIDTLLRGYDVPKLYWHRVGKNPDQYEVVDGQQRLHAIWDFYEDQYALPLDADPVNGHKIAGLCYSELPDDVRSKLDEYSLDIVILEDANEDEARELFARLQNGTTLKASEKRNAMRGNMRNIVREFAGHEFFKRCGFTDKRFDFDQVVAQMLILEMAHEPCDISDKELTKAYDEYADQDFEHGDGKKTISKLGKVIGFLSRAFPEKTPELKKTSTVSLYWLVSTLMETHVIWGTEKTFGNWFIDFERRRFEDEKKPQDERDPDMVSYHDYTNQATNSQESIAFRHEILSRSFMLTFPDLTRLDNQREFTFEQRLAIFRQYNGICQWVDTNGARCEERCLWSDWHADHIIPWSKGGLTTVTNGQVLCPKHNLAKGNRLSDTGLLHAAPESFAKSNTVKATTNSGRDEAIENHFDTNHRAIPSETTDTQNIETDKPYADVLEKLRRMGWSPQQLSGVGRTGYSLNALRSEVVLLRYAKKQKQGRSDYFFFGVTPSIMDKLSAFGNSHVLLVCGDSSHVLVFPEQDFRQLMGTVPQAGAFSEWKIKIYYSALQWTLYPSGKPVDVSKYLNRYPEP